jgi:hypothetical protein
MADRDQKYLERLTRWLRFYGTSGPQIIAILSEATAHPVDSGEDPNEAFGTPQTYAHQFSQRSQLSWTRRTSGVVALGTAVACCLFIAEAIAHADTQRPDPWSMPQWMVVLAAILSAVLSWRSSLYVFSPPLSAVAEEEVDVALAWKRRVRLRVMVSLILIIMVVAVSSPWGISLGHAYLQVPRLRTANFVDSSIQPGDTSTTMVVQTVLYLDAPRPSTNL